jgi:hypothetical protein
MRRIMVQGQSGEIVWETPISKNNQSKIDWRCGSSGRMPALQARSPEFKNPNPSWVLMAHTYNLATQEAEIRRMAV